MGTMDSIRGTEEKTIVRMMNRRSKEALTRTENIVILLRKTNRTASISGKG